MKVLKFGGTSMGTVDSLYQIQSILISDKTQKFVVCSAMSGITDQLINLAKAVKQKNKKNALKYIDLIASRHFNVIDALIESLNFRILLKNEVLRTLDGVLDLFMQDYSKAIEYQVITSGEILITRIFSSYLNLTGIPNIHLDAKDFMRVDSLENPDINEVYRRLNNILTSQNNTDIFITQGFICKNHKNEISHLKRGGSDYTASIIGAAVDAEEIQIWTDIDGLHNNDPRFVNSTYPIPEISFEEASELAFFGAKILHPETVLPAIQKNIPILIKNTFKPYSKGTVISEKVNITGLKAIAAEDNTMMLKIKSERILTNHQYIKAVFDIFDEYSIAPKLVNISNTMISVIINKLEHLKKITVALNKFSVVTVHKDCTIITVVGKSITNDKNFCKIFESKSLCPLKMINYEGNSKVSLVVDSRQKVTVLRSLNERLFQEYYEAIAFS
ncbi:aspartate kinase [Aquimarina litoralis]|uniref:Aspartokinase n=1 Tax=Aquimarina litoralis TaxID=584605 RepID=A0ABP3UDY0_9FLAO